jgi:hypothetical protein
VFLPKERFHYAWATHDDTEFQVNAIGPFAITYAHPRTTRATGSTSAALSATATAGKG